MTEHTVDITTTMPQLPTTPGYACWYEIPVRDLAKGQAFYEAVLDIKMIYEQNEVLPNPMVWFADPKTPGSLGHLYPGKPADTGNGPTIHLLATEPLEKVIERVEPAGGEVVSPIIDIPIGRFVYITDPDGNSIGLFNFDQKAT
ncbi:MAG: VOC family protein [Pseudomonadota bacterium]